MRLRSIDPTAMTLRWTAGQVIVEPPVLPAAAITMTFSRAARSRARPMGPEQEGILISQAEVDDLRSMIDRVVHGPGYDVKRGDQTLFLPPKHLQRHQLDVGRDAADTNAVAGQRPDDSGHASTVFVVGMKRRGVITVVGATNRPVAEVSARHP